MELRHLPILVPSEVFYRKYGKRVFDFVISGILLILLSPIMIGVTVLVLVFSGRPVLFRQERPGFHGRIFKLNKFRTMNLGDEGTDRLMSDKQRLTAVGSLLRRTHLDELPQLTNVLCGQMSLVGPRPLLVEYLARYTPQQTRRHDVLPGMTGWAQVNGGNRLTWETRFELDLWYVDHLSLGLDLRILAKTMLSIAQGVHAPVEELATSEFRGADPECP
jgi:lipopolysaccharide/colanic/teichoic acid biosynthesis glycosyltransferase